MEIGLESLDGQVDTVIVAKTSNCSGQAGDDNRFAKSTHKPK